MEEILGTQAPLGGQRVHPKQAHAVLGQRHSLWVHDGEQIRSSLLRTLFFLQEVAQRDGTVLFINRNPLYEPLVREVASMCRQPHVQTKWTAGLLSNWDQTQRQLDHYASFTNRYGDWLDQNDKSFPMYLRMQKRFDGLKSLRSLPDACIFLSLADNQAAFREACQLNIPTIGFLNTDMNPTKVDYPIYGQTQSLQWMHYVLESFALCFLKYPPSERG
uniref:Ribosomal protein S2 n=1 Tax=Chloropicon maureeniae TaxID=1461542 RepID=A0A4D6C559_9CHLO|nr:ribosomal protein S2 [Chloropicon maureeniae]QBX98825.1 ribosomal protein S2 [Chloropicon maureeniae]